MFGWCLWGDVCEMVFCFDLLRGTDWGLVRCGVLTDSGATGIMMD